MATLHELRGKLSARAEALEARVQSLEVQLALGKAEAADRMEDAKKRYAKALQQLRRRIGESKAVAEDVRSNLLTRADELQVQLALGKAESRDALAAQRAKVEHAWTELDARLKGAGNAAAREWEKVSETLADSALALEIEMDALQTRFELERSRGELALHEAGRSLAERIGAFKAKAADRKSAAQDKLAGFERDLKVAYEDLKRAFRDLTG
jgi:hypothetical protein